MARLLIHLVFLLPQMLQFLSRLSLEMEKEEEHMLPYAQAHRRCKAWIGKLVSVITFGLESFAKYTSSDLNIRVLVAARHVKALDTWERVWESVITISQLQTSWLCWQACGFPRTGSLTKIKQIVTKSVPLSVMYSLNKNNKFKY